jgi:1-deoxy-D-xylulose-5-phosphate synthase
MAVVTLGPIGNIAAKAIERAEKEKNISIAHYDLRFLKPLDEEMLHEIGRSFSRIITIEDGIRKGGMGLPSWNLCRTTNIHHTYTA